jgi:hypothetical protein
MPANRSSAWASRHHLPLRRLHRALRRQVGHHLQRRHAQRRGLGAGLQAVAARRAVLASDEVRAADAARLPPPAQVAGRRNPESAMKKVPVPVSGCERGRDPGLGGRAPASIHQVTGRLTLSDGPAVRCAVLPRWREIGASPRGARALPVFGWVESGEYAREQGPRWRLRVARTSAPASETSEAARDRHGPFVASPRRSSCPVRSHPTPGSAGARQARRVDFVCRCP